jgi:hypothetical protein
MTAMAMKMMMLMIMIELTNAGNTVTTGHGPISSSGPNNKRNIKANFLVVRG